MGRLAEVTDLDRTAMLLAWDQEVCMPAGAADEHGELRATLGRFAHERFVDDRVGELLEAAAPRDDVEADVVRVARREFDKARRVPGAPLTLRVTDDGRASCNHRPLVEITSAQLVTAREVERDLEDPAKAQLRLASGPQPVFSYRVRTEEGGVAWSDDSARQPAVLFKLAKLTRDVAKGPCRLPR